MERRPPKTDHPSLLLPVALFTGPIGFTCQSSTLLDAPLAFQNKGTNNSGAAALAAQPLRGATICQVGPGNARCCSCDVTKTRRCSQEVELFKRFCSCGCRLVSRRPAESAGASVFPTETWTFPPSLCSPDQLRLKNDGGEREHSSARPSVTWRARLEDETSVTFSALARRSRCCCTLIAAAVGPCSMKLAINIVNGWIGL